MKRNFLLPAVGLAAAIALAGCGTTTDPGTSTPAASGQASSTAAGSMASAEHNQADTLFAQMMIPHHQQAVQMSDMMLSKDGTGNEITDLATRIKEAQGPEIQTMTGWLEAWDEPVDGVEGADMAGMEGMMAEDQMKDLDSAEGDEASRMFLESMTEHHQGAVGMAKDEIAEGQNPEAIALAKEVVKTQQAEIKEMKTLLANL